MMDGRAARTRENEVSLPPFLFFFAQTSPYFPPRCFYLFPLRGKGASSLPCSLAVLSFVLPRVPPAISRFLAPNNIWQLLDPISFRSGTTRCKSSRYACHINNACHSRGFIRLKRSIVLANVYLDRSSVRQRVICCTDVASQPYECNFCRYT